MNQGRTSWIKCGLQVLNGTFMSSNVTMYMYVWYSHPWAGVLHPLNEHLLISTERHLSRSCVHGPAVTVQVIRTSVCVTTCTCQTSNDVTCCCNNSILHLVTPTNQTSPGQSKCTTKFTFSFQFSNVLVVMFRYFKLKHFWDYLTFPLIYITNLYNMW